MSDIFLILGVLLNFCYVLIVPNLLHHLATILTAVLPSCRNFELQGHISFYYFAMSACDCHPMGTSGRVCGPTGDQCPCKPSYTGAKCDQCAPGYYGFPNCRSEYLLAIYLVNDLPCYIPFLIEHLMKVMHL